MPPILLALALSARAQTTLTLHPERPIDDPRGPGAFTPTALIPAGEEILVHVPLDDDAEVTASLDVWPRPPAADDPCKARPTSGKQVYRLGFSEAGSAGERYLETRVPRLQSRQRYCMRVTVTRTPDDAEWGQIAREAAVRMDQAPPDDCGEAGFGTVLDAKLDAVLKARHVVIGEEELRTAKERARGVYATGAGATSCLAWKANGALVAQLEAQLPGQDDAIRNHAQALPTAPVPPFSSPLVEINGKLTTVARLVNGTSDPARLEAAAEELSQCPDAACEHWRKRIVEVVEADAGTPRAQAVAALRSAVAAGELARPAKLYLRDKDGRWVTLEELRGSLAFARLPIADVRRQIRDLSTEQESGPKAALDAWDAALARYDHALQARVALAGTLASARSARDAGQKGWREAALAALADETVRRSARATVAHSVEVAEIDAHRTPAVDSLVAPQAGFAVAAPLGGSEASAWAFPYVGVAVHLGHADRRIALDQTVGNPVGQRLALFLGTTLTGATMEVPGRDVSPLFGAVHPVGGLSGRVTQFANISAGAAVYRLADVNPASSRLHFSAAPFLSVSVDFDVISAFKNIQGG